MSSKEEKKLNAIQKAQAENLRKFAKEREVFKANPEMKSKKKDLFLYIDNIMHLIDDCDYQLGLIQEEFEPKIRVLVEEQARVSKSFIDDKTTYIEAKNQLAKELEELQTQGIFIDSSKWTFAKGRMTKDHVATLAHLSPEDQLNYKIQRIEYDLDKKKIEKELKDQLIFKVGDPQIKHKARSSPDRSEEEFRDE